MTSHGGPQVFQVQELADPSPGSDQVVIEVRAAGINFTDLMTRLGLDPDAPKPPRVIGYEVAGVVSALGAGVGGVEVGQRVIAPTWSGGYAEQALARADSVLALPDGMDYEHGAAVPINYITAWEALIRSGNLQPDERVLIHSAAGGVGIAATQIAKRRGAEVWGAASPWKHEAIRGFGVDHPVDYTRAGWESALPKLDLIVDARGGASLRRSYRLLRAGGRLVCLGAYDAVAGEPHGAVTAESSRSRMPRFNLLTQMLESKTVIGLNVDALWDDVGPSRWTRALRGLLRDGTIKPVVAQAFSFERAGEAHRFIAERRNIGKVVLIP